MKTLSIVAALVGLLSLANVVQARTYAVLLNDGTLAVVGDHEGQSVQVVVSSSNRIIIRHSTGANIPINNQDFSATAQPRVNELSRLYFAMLGGRDTVTIDQSWHQRAANVPLQIETGAGNDHISPGIGTLAPGSYIHGGANADTIVRTFGLGRFGFVTVSPRMDDFSSAEGDQTQNVFSKGRRF